MHPDRRFAWEDEAAMRRFVADVSFAHLFVAAAGGVAVAHVPLLVTAAGLEFHMPRRNRATPLLAEEGATVLASVSGPDAYVSPGWYASPDQVPTWNYVAVEVEGRIACLDESRLIAHLDALSTEQERRLAPAPAWTREKMAEERFQAMLPAIAAFEIRPTAWRGTRKLSQNKAAADVRGVIEGYRRIGRDDAATLVAQANEARI